MKYQIEREQLVEETKQYQELLDDPLVAPDVVQLTIEELRAIRMRIHALDLQIDALKKNHTSQAG